MNEQEQRQKDIERWIEQTEREVVKVMKQIPSNQFFGYKGETQ